MVDRAAQDWQGELHRRINTVLAEVDKLISAHQPNPAGDIGWLPDGGYGKIDPACAVCGTPDEYAVAWPCNHHDTLTRIRRTLTGEDHE